MAIQEYQERQQIYQTNLNFIKQHNSEDHSYQVQVVADNKSKYCWCRHVLEAQDSR